jgi:hypothetical protein
MHLTSHSLVSSQAPNSLSPPPRDIVHIALAPKFEPGDAAELKIQSQVCAKQPPEQSGNLLEDLEWGRRSTVERATTEARFSSLAPN